MKILAMNKHPPQKPNMGIIISRLKSVHMSQMVTNHHVWSSIPAIQIHQVNWTTFKHQSFVYVLLGPVRTLPQQWAIVLHIPGYAEQMSLFPTICVITKHLPVQHLAVSKMSMLFINCHLAVTITESRHIMDIIVFSGSRSFIHFDLIAM
jgi:hypothetical protein